MTGWLRRISYVDDNTDNRALAQLTLAQTAGYHLQVCRSGADALNRIPEFDPDVILLDHTMPETGSITTYHALRALPETQRTPIVLITRERGRSVQVYADLDIAGVLHRPFDPIALARDVEALWRNTQPMAQDY